MRDKTPFFLFIIMLMMASTYSCSIQQRRDSILSIALPDKPWAVAIKANGFKVQSHKFLPNEESVHIYAKNEASKMDIAVDIVKTSQKFSSKDARAYYLKSFFLEMPLNEEDLKLYEVGTFAIFEFTIKEYQGLQINQRHAVAFLVKDDNLVTINFRTVFAVGEDGLFEDLLNNIKIDDSSIRSSAQYFEYGRGYFMNEDYKNAVKYYEKALSSEKENSQLDKGKWGILIDELGVANLRAKNFRRAEEIFLYGISRDEHHALFYYNLACVYAETDDLDNALLNLRKAFEYRSPYEGMPDPMKDASFERFLKNERFIKTLEEPPIATLAYSEIKKEEKESRVKIPAFVEGKWSGVIIAVRNKITGQSDEYAVNLKSNFHLPDSDIKIWIEHLLPDFMIDVDNRLTSASNQPNNPAVYMEVFEGSNVIYRGWQYAKFPMIKPIEHPKYEIYLNSGIPR